MLTPMFFGPCRRYDCGYAPAQRYAADPFGEMAQMTRAMDRMVGSLVEELNEGPLQQIPAHDRHQLHFAENGDLSVRLPTVGYLPAELKVDVDGDHLIVEGNHNEERDGQSIQRHFKRSIRLADTVDKERIRCELDEKSGELKLDIPQRQQPLEAAKQSVPIEMKKPADV